MRHAILTMGAAAILVSAAGAAAAQPMGGAAQSQSMGNSLNNWSNNPQNSQVPVTGDQSMTRSTTGQPRSGVDCNANPNAAGCKGYYTNSSDGYYDANGKWHSAKAHKEKGWYDSTGTWHSGAKPGQSSPQGYYNDQRSGFSDANGHWHPTDAPVDTTPH